MNDIESQVCEDIRDRQKRGIAKYGVTVANNPLELKAWLQHAYEETLDKAVYLRRAIAEVDSFAGWSLESAKALCEANGLRISKVRDWETLTEFAGRIRVKISTASMRLKHPKCPPFEAIRTESGAIRYLESHELLDEFVKSHGAPRGLQSR